MQIKIIAVSDIKNVPTAKGSYDTLEVTYKNLSFDGKVEAKKLMSFTNKEVFNAIKSSSANDIFEITRQKDDKGYWQWIGIGPSNGAPATVSVTAKTTAPNPAPKSTYETAEERAARQVMIVRQSSLATAVNLLKTDKKVPPVAEILLVAKQFESYVFGTQLEVETEKLPELPEDEDIPM